MFKTLALVLAAPLFICASAHAKSFDARPTKTQITKIENAAVKYAQKQLRTSPVFVGNVNNDTPKIPVFSWKNRQVLVSTGDEASPQFGVWKVSLSKTGKPVGITEVP